MLDAEMLGELVGSLVGEAVERATAPLREEIAALRADIASRPDAKAHAEFLTRAVLDAAAAIPKAKDGKDGVDGRDGAPGESGQKGADGVDGRDGAPGESGQKGDRGESGAKGDPGKDADPINIDAVRAMISDAVDALPSPQVINGKDADPVEVAAIIRDEVGRQFALLQDHIKAAPIVEDTGKAEAEASKLLAAVMSKIMEAVNE